MHPDLQQFVAATLESPNVVEDLTWQDGNRPTVLKVADDAGRLYIVKRHVLETKFRGELRAYEHWTPHLGDRAPRLYAADDLLRTLILTALPGDTPSDWAQVDLLQQAGQLLRRLHNAEKLPPYHDLVADKMQELDEIKDQALPLVGAEAIEIARRRLASLETLPAPRKVPCHLDYSPRNWLVHEDRLQIIDFGDAQPDAWVNDFGRLYLGWHLSPELRAAFIAGYRHDPSADDLATLRSCYIARLIEHVVFARQHGYIHAEAASRELLTELIGTKTPNAT